MTCRPRALDCAIALSCLAWGGASAQSIQAKAVASPPALRQPLRISINTPIVFEFVATLDSKKSKIDEMFPIRLLRPILVDGQIAVPEGAMGMGQVVHAAKAGFAGKAGELIVTVRYLEHRGGRIPLRRFRMGEPETGEDRRDTAFGVGLAVPFGGFLVRGGEKTILAGTRGNAIVSADTEIEAAPEPQGGAAN
jgi:hypothetical protein